MALSRREQEQVENLLNEAAEEGARRGQSSALRRVLASRARDLLRADYDAARGILESLGAFGTLSRLADAFVPESVRRWFEGLRPAIADVAYAATEPKEEVLGISFDPGNEAMARFLDDYVSELADRLSQTTHDQVIEVIRGAQEEGLGVKETSERLQEKAGIETKRRADLIARNELQRTSKGAAYFQALESGMVKTKTHRHQHDEDVRDEHRFEETVPINRPYKNGEVWSGQLSISCRCEDEFGIDFEALEARGS